MVIIMPFFWLDHISLFLCKTTVKFQFYCIFLRKSILKGSMRVVCKELYITKRLKVEDISTDLNFAEAVYLISRPSDKIPCFNKISGTCFEKAETPAQVTRARSRLGTTE